MNRIKILFTLIISICLSSVVNAQEFTSIDSIPKSEVDNNYIFSKVVQAKGLDKSQISSTILAWSIAVVTRKNITSVQENKFTKYNLCYPGTLSMADDKLVFQIHFGKNLKRKVNHFNAKKMNMVAKAKLTFYIKDGRFKYELTDFVTHSASDNIYARQNTFFKPRSFEHKKVSPEFILDILNSIPNSMKELEDDIKKVQKELNSDW